MSDNIIEGKWFDIKNAEEHTTLKQYGDLVKRSGRFATMQFGDYVGPGKYMLLQYHTGGRCGDDVNRVLTAPEVAKRAREEIRELAEVLKQAVLKPGD